MSDEKEPTSSAQAPPSPPIAVDWDSEPDPVYCNGVQVTGDVRIFSVVFVEANAARGVRGGDLGPFMPGRIVSSLRMDPQTFFNVLSAMAGRWNEFAELLEKSGGGTHVPRVRIGPLTSNSTKTEAEGG